MKNSFLKTPIKFIALAIMATVLITACKKDTAKPPLQKVEAAPSGVQQPVSIQTLTEYYAGLIQVKPELVTYDAKTGMILLYGAAQIDKEKLTKIYLNNKAK
jgi:hypothetical protein